MQVILREDVDKLGQSGEVVNVREGYGRNYLLPRGLAVLATKKDVARVEHEKKVISARAAKLMKETQAAADRLSQVSVSIPCAVGEGDKLYGSVTVRDIADAMAAKGFPVDAKKLVLDEPLKSLGMVEVPVKLGRGIEAKIKVWVVKKED